MFTRVKLRNQILKAAEGKKLLLDIKLTNSKVNGRILGCSGHITDLISGVCVYTITDAISYEPLARKSMYRLAENDKDYGSNRIRNGYNCWCKDEELAECIVKLILIERGARNSG